MLTQRSQNKYLIWKGKIVILKKGEDGLYRDPDGCIIAVENEYSKDPIVRCGVGRLSLPTSHPLTAACKPHDFMYNSAAYQAFHTREEADKEFKRLLSLVSEGKWYSEISQSFYWIASIFGGRYWENEKTR